MIFFTFIGLLLHVPVKSYGHVGTVSSHNHISPGYGNQYSVHMLSLVTDGMNDQWRVENDGRNYFMMNLCEHIGPGRD